MSGVVQHLPQLVPFLITSLSEKKGKIEFCFYETNDKHDDHFSLIHCENYNFLTAVHILTFHNRRINTCIKHELTTFSF